MTDGPFVSYAQNGEDVVLHRALADIENGRYVDVGANDPVLDSVTQAFYQAGWRGITVEPVPSYAERQRIQRPEDRLVEALAGSTTGPAVPFFQVPDTGLSTTDPAIAEQHRQDGRQIHEVQVTTRSLNDILTEAGWAGSDIHFLSIDVEGAEGEVLAGLDLHQWRPWIILAEATRPQTDEPTFQSWEPVLLAAHYRFALFDGLSRFYVATEHWEDLHAALQAPANPLDRYVHYRAAEQQIELQERTTDHQVALARLADVSSSLATAQERHARLAAQAALREEAALRTALAWRTRAVGVWADSAGSGPTADSEELDFLRRQTHELTRELTAIRHTLSWRVTRPLRGLRTLIKRTGR